MVQTNVTMSSLSTVVSPGSFRTIFFPPPIAFFVLQKGIEGGLKEIVVCGVVCIVYSILPLHVLLNLKQVLVLHVGKKCLNCRS